MASIFISYRRDDGAGHAGRLYDRLSARCGADQVFIDHYDLAPGQDFPSAIESSLARADDFVRRELLAALTAGKQVIPVLIGGAKMPGIADLPAELASLSRLQAWELRDSRFEDDLNALLAQLSASSPSSDPPGDRRAPDRRVGGHRARGGWCTFHPAQRGGARRRDPPNHPSLSCAPGERRVARAHAIDGRFLGQPAADVHRATRAGKVRAESTPLHKGGTRTWQTRVTDESGRLVSLTIQTQSIL